MTKTDAEITLNFKAEYRQALLAIANMSKALKELQSQAHIMLNVGNAGSPDKQGAGVNMNPAEVAKFRDVMAQTAQAVAGVSAELVKLGENLAKSHTPPEKVREVAELAQTYSTLASSVTAAAAALNKLSGEGENSSPQMAVFTERIKLLQDQVTQLQKQIDEMQRTHAPGPGENGNTGPVDSTMKANVRTMTWLQQAQAARRLGRAVSEITEKLSTLAEDAEKGSLNLTALAGDVALVAYAMRGALGPISAVVLAVELLQGAWNTYAKSRQAQLRAERDERESFRMTEEALKAVTKAKEAYLEKQVRFSEIEQIKETYRQLNDEIERGRRLIEETTRSEMQRLALTQDAEEHAEAMRRLELNDRLTRGEITQEEYQTELVTMRRAKAQRAAAADISRAESEARAAGERRRLAQRTLSERDISLTAASNDLAGFMSEEEIEELSRGLEALQERRQERYARYRELEARQESQVFGGMGGFEAIALQNELQAVKRELHAADRALLDYQTFIEEATGGESIEDYSARRRQSQERYNVAESERRRAAETLEAGIREEEQARQREAETRAKSAQATEQARQIAEAEMRAIETRRAANEERSRRDAELTRKREEAETLERAALARRIEEARREAGEAGLNHLERAHRERVARMYEEEAANRRERGAQTIRAVRELAAEGRGNEITRWAAGNVEDIAGQRINAQQAQAIIERGTKALQTRTQQDDAIMEELIKQARYNESVTHRQQSQIQRLQSELRESRRRQERMSRELL